MQILFLLLLFAVSIIVRIFALDVMSLNLNPGIMKHYSAFIAALLLLAGCTGGNKASSHFSVNPLASDVSVDSLTDCTVAASFSVGDFDWRGGRLAMTIYNAYRYDAADVARMQVGDTIVYEGKSLPIDSIERRDSFVIVNGGIEEGGAELTASTGGTYRATTLDDHSVYRVLGKRAVPLAEDFVFIDCRESPTDPSDTIRSGQKAYIEKLRDYKREFSPLNTRVRIEGGAIKGIHRHWIP